MAKDSELFQALVIQLTQASWVALGKIANPMTGKVDRDLDVARLTIDTLEALETRTKGNLDETERILLDRSLRDLRLNYVDERKKPDPVEKIEESEKTGAEVSSEPPPEEPSKDEAEPEATDKPTS